MVTLALELHIMSVMYVFLWSKCIKGRRLAKGSNMAQRWNEGDDDVGVKEREREGMWFL